MTKFALTTRQMRPGVLIATPHGWQFVPLMAVLLTVAAFALAVTARLTVDTIAAEGYLLRVARAEVGYHADVLAVGFGVVVWLFNPRYV